MDKQVWNNLANAYSLEDLPEKYQIISEIIGFDNLIKLCEYARGSEIYFPTPERILSKTRNRVIKSEYDGNNIADLANKYGMTVRNLRLILIKSSDSSECTDS